MSPTRQGKDIGWRNGATPWDHSHEMNALPKPSTYVAEAIMRRMTHAGLSRRALAAKAGVNETYVRDILIGKSRNPKHQQLTAIATALNCSVLDLIDPKLASKPITQSEVVDKPEERAWLAYLRALNPADRERLLLDMIRGPSHERNDA